MDTSSGLCHEKSVLSVPVRVRVSNTSFFVFPSVEKVRHRALPYCF